MAELSFDCLDVRPERYGAAPTLLFRMRVADAAGGRIHAIALRTQIRVECQNRRYNANESELLNHLFGDPSRWGETLRPIQLATISVVVPSFTGSTEFEVAVPCSYDLEVAAGKYFHALDDGVIPLSMLFSGTVFGKGEKGFWVEQVPWHLDASYRMPVAVWQELVDLYFPDSAWIRLQESTVDAVLRFKSAHAIPTWDQAIEILLERAGEKT